MQVLTTQAQVDAFFADLLDAGYPYMGTPEHNRHVLLADGSIRSDWTKMDESGWEDESEGTVSTQEEIAESVYCWQHDC